MAIFKIIGTIIKTVERDNQRVDVSYPAYRLIRINGTKKDNTPAEAYKRGMSRAIMRAAHYLGFSEGFTSAFVCNDSASNSTDKLPSFKDYDDAVNVV